MKVKLGDICNISSSKRIFESEYVENGVPFVRGLEISDGSVLKQDVQYECYISETRYEEIKRLYGVPQIGDILITAVGTIGNLCYIDREKAFYFKDGNVLWFNNFDRRVYSKYLYYFMQSNYFKKQLEYAMIGAVQKALTMVMLSKIEIDLPDYDIQVFTTKVLENLDDKINNNNKINTHLEIMAKTIFDYWFLQFDFPNEEGKPYKSSGGKMVWNEGLKREIPDGWKVKTIEMLCNLQNGINYDKNFIGNKTYKIVNVRNITASTVILDSSEFDSITLNSAQADKYLVDRNDILIARSGTPGAVRIILEECQHTIFCGFVICCSPKEIEHRLYLTYSLKALEGSGATKTGGSIMQNVSQDTLKKVSVCIPDKHVLEDYNNKIEVILDKIQNIITENQQLISLRDFLLPLLMNGQVGFEKNN